MVPQKIQALFDFIDYLDQNKKLYIEKYVPLCNELKALYYQREKLNPRNNYIEKQEYDKIQSIINDKTTPITQYIYNPITDKLRELGIWNGDDTFNSIWNNNSSAINEFKENFKTEDISLLMKSKRKYLCFRRETNTDFLYLIFAFNNLDEIFKDLFDFFKDTSENEFEGFEAKKIEANSFGEALKLFKENPVENIKFTIPVETIFKRPMNIETRTSNSIINNEIILGSKFQIGDISNNNGSLTIGDENKTSTNDKDEIAKKSFNWQKWGVIASVILAIIAIVVTIMVS